MAQAPKGQWFMFLYALCSLCISRLALSGFRPSLSLLDFYLSCRWEWWWWNSAYWIRGARKLYKGSLIHRSCPMPLNVEPSLLLLLKQLQFDVVGLDDLDAATKLGVQNWYRNLLEMQRLGRDYCRCMPYLRSISALVAKRSRPCAFAK